MLLSYGCRRFTARPRSGLVAVALTALTLALTPAAAGGDGTGAYVAPPLLAAAQKNEDASFKVIVQGRKADTASVAAEVHAAIDGTPGHGARIRRRFSVIGGVAAELTGKQILSLARRPRVAAITPDLPLRASDLGAGPVSIAPPAVTGTAEEGATLSSDAGSWTGLEPLAFGYQWQRCDALGASCVNIADGTASTYTIGTADAGATLISAVTATDATGATTTTRSLPTIAVAAAPAAPASPVLPTAEPPANLTLPAIRGFAAETETLTANPGTWSPATGLTFAYEWLRCDAVGATCTPIADATGASYVTGPADVGATIGLSVTAKAADATWATVFAGTTAVVTPPQFGGLWSSQLWPYAANVARLWTATGSVPTIAVVDSGIDAARADFGGRVAAQVDLTSGATANSAGDGRGHGTVVASIAAGSALGHVGAAPTARIVSLDVLDDAGMGETSSVIAAADWILEHRDSDGIRVANFSLTGSAPTSFETDPLGKAVERLWLSGVVVVAAAGNYTGLGTTRS